MVLDQDFVLKKKKNQVMVWDCSSVVELARSGLGSTAKFIQIKR